MKNGAGKRHPVRIILISVLSVAVLLVGATQFLVSRLYSANFDIRFDSEEKTSVVSDFPGLSYQSLTFPSDKGQMLYGDYLWRESAGGTTPKAVVVVSHGYGGGGYRWYLDQINYLAEHGYLVFAFDKTGTDGSEGVSLRGLPQGVIDLQYALAAVRQQEISGGLPIYLYGHSWGGFSSCAVLEYETDIEAVASLSGFNQSKDMLIDWGIDMYGGWVRTMDPFLTVCDYVRFGSRAFDSSEKGLAVTKAEVLLFHSADDPKINVANSFDLYESKFGERPNLHFVRLTDLGHNVMYRNEQLNEEVMSQIVEFYDKVTAAK